MLEIRALQKELIPALVDLAKTTFIQSHGHSASKEDIEHYTSTKINIVELNREYENESNLFHLLYLDNRLIGYSKLCLNASYRLISEDPVAKLERLYLLEDYIGRGFGLELLNFNIELSKSHNQLGMWLYVWIHNDRGIQFYKRAGFEKIGEEDFKISNTHSNPNHIMYLKD